MQQSLQPVYVFTTEQNELFIVFTETFTETAFALPKIITGII
jgi:hypothetical protein